MAEKRRVAQQTFLCEMKINDYGQPKTLHEVTTLKLVSSVVWLPTTTWKTSLLSYNGKLLLMGKISEADPIWTTELPYSHKLVSNLNVKILDSDGCTWQEVNSEKCEKNIYIPLYDLGLEKKVPMKEDNTLTVSIMITLYVANMFNKPAAFEKRFCSDLLYMLEDGTGADLTIIAKDGVEVQAHKFILTARSPVFKAMMTGDTLEARSGVIRMDDVSSAAVQSLLRYLYGAELPMFVVNGGENSKLACVSQLIAMADKYMLASLKEWFNNNLAKCCHKEEPENVIFLLKMAKMYSLKEAHSEVRAFIRDNGAVLTYALDVLESHECEKFILMNMGGKASAASS